MLREGIRLVMGWLRRAVTQPFEELNRWQRAARFAYDLGRHGARQLQEDRAPQMAAALAFRTLFGLAPVLVVATILVKAIKGSEAILRSLRELFVAAGLDKIHVISESDVAALPDDAAVTLAEWLENLTGRAGKHESVGHWLGGVGRDYLCRHRADGHDREQLQYHLPSAGGRPWTRRVPLYWFILTVSPVLLGPGVLCEQPIRGLDCVR